MDEKIFIKKGLGDYVIIEKEGLEEKSSVTIIRDKPKFSRGKVVACAVDSIVPGDRVIFYTDMADVIGLGFPPNFVVVMMENIILSCGKEE